MLTYETDFQNFLKRLRSRDNDSLFNKELMCYLNRKLKLLEIQLFECIYYKKDQAGDEASLQAIIKNFETSS
ncbi:hypothetical protein [Clostridium sp. JS66]|uniref:hypothetical protein n=1 Tax=Clostridium sp. JS66 TaxID=3064705 RepID=UPI00298E341B|nr:hypothetical protein [Clostridium sp. JS66]WPC39834.1 hypothetical protein Q6H37_18165 [Clostridium sp. JS66]